MLKNSIMERSKLILATNAKVFNINGNASQKVRSVVLRNITRKFGELPDNIGEFEPFEYFEGRARVEAFRNDELDVWAARYSEPDTSVAGRDWIVECVSIEANGDSYFSNRLLCYSAVHDFSFIPSTPGPLKEICQNMTLHWGDVALLPEVSEVGVDCEISDILREVETDSRWWNTIVVSGSQDERYGIDAARLHRHVKGCANVYFLPVDLIGEFQRAFGAENKVFGGGARTFTPGFSSLDREITANPVIRAPYRGSHWQHDRAIHILATSAFRSSTDRLNLREIVPSFASIRQAASKFRSKNRTNKYDKTEELALLKDEVLAAGTEVEEALQLASQAEEQVVEANEKFEAEKALVFSLRSRVEMLERALNEQGRDFSKVPPDNYEALADWAEENYAGKLRFTPRARKLLKKAEYHQISDVIKALEILAGAYRDTKLGGDYRTFEGECAAAGFEESKSISKSSAGKQGEEYFVQYAGGKHFLDRHLKKGNSKDPRYCMRVYYFFDDENEIVVVGALPNHLDTQQT